jgi:hypothetical protein
MNLCQFLSIVITAVYYVEAEIKLWNSENLELLRYRWLCLVQHYGVTEVSLTVFSAALWSYWGIADCI